MNIKLYNEVLGEILNSLHKKYKEFSLLDEKNIGKLTALRIKGCFFMFVV